MLQRFRRAALRIHRRLLPDDPQIGWTPYVWLVYLSFLFFRYFFQDVDSLHLGLTLGSIAVFLPLYFAGYWVCGHRKLLIIAAIAALGVLLAPINTGASVYIVFASAFAGTLHPPRQAFQVLVLAVLSAVFAFVVFDVHFSYLIVAVVVSLLVGGVNIYYCQMHRKNAELRLSREELKKITALAERERIARDLHDLLGHTLSLITLKAELAGKILRRDPTQAGKEIRDVERVSRQALSQVRTAITGFRSAGLEGELANARLALETAGTRFEYDNDVQGLPVSHETVLALVLREAVTNVVRHAGASHCRVRIRRADDQVIMSVSDDGRGGIRHEGTGLTGMRERIGELEGSLEIESEAGTRLSIRLPLPEEGREAPERAAISHP